MSLLRRRKSPHLNLVVVHKKIKPSKVKSKPSKLIVKKIVNPLTGRKINFAGPTHAKLIKNKVLNEAGTDIRVKKNGKSHKTTNKKSHKTESNI